MSFSQQVKTFLCSVFEKRWISSSFFQKQIKKVWPVCFLTIYTGQDFFEFCVWKKEEFLLLFFQAQIKKVWSVNFFTTYTGQNFFMFCLWKKRRISPSFFFKDKLKKVWSVLKKFFDKEIFHQVQTLFLFYI